MKKVLYSLIIILTIVSLYFLNKKSNKSSDKKQQQDISFHIGTYTKTTSKGIYKCTLQKDGKINLTGLSTKAVNPSYLAKTADKRYLLAVSEEENGMVSSYKINGDSLEFISESPTGGAHPCHVSVNAEGDVIVANYTGGNVGLLKIDDQGVLSPLLDVQQHYGKSITARQEAPHAHSAWFGANSKDIIAVDLGTDELMFSSIDSEQGKLIPSVPDKFKLEAGAGPRHIVFHPSEDWIYTMNELNASVSLLKKQEGSYTLVSSITTLPDGWTGKNKCADIHISKDGKFLYTSNRGHNSLAIFAVAADGVLSVVGHESTRGDGPRSFAMSPDEDFVLVANEQTDNVVCFGRDFGDWAAGVCWGGGGWGSGLCFVLGF